jgi:hypothetical protein
VLKKHDFSNEWNPKVHVRYRDNERIFIQAFWYEALIESAKKRNQAFFSVLFGTKKIYLAGFNFCIQTEEPFWTKEFFHASLNFGKIVEANLDAFPYRSHEHERNQRTTEAHTRSCGNGCPCGW